MSIMDFFRGPAAADQGNQSPQNQSAQGAPQTVPANPAAQPNPTNPTVPNKDPQAPESQLDSFKDLWKADNTAAPTSPLGNLDQAKINEAAGKIDFTRVIPKEALSKIAAGGEEATVAFAQSLNSVAQAVFANSTAANASIVENALANQRKQFESALPQLLKQHGLGEALVTQNPLLTHPAAQPMVEAIKQQMVQQYPKATQQELMEMTGRYFDQMAGLFKKPDVPDPVAAKKASGDDWSTFLA